MKRKQTHDNYCDEMTGKGSIQHKKSGML